MLPDISMLLAFRSKRGNSDARQSSDDAARLTSLLTRFRMSVAWWTDVKEAPMPVTSESLEWGYTYF